MPENERHVEVGLHLDITDFEQKLEQATQAAGQAQQQIAGSFDPNVALGAAGLSQNTPPPGSPALSGGGFAASGGAAVFLPPQTDPGVVGSPEILTSPFTGRVHLGGVDLSQYLVNNPAPAPSLLPPQADPGVVGSPEILTSPFTGRVHLGGVDLSQYLVNNPAPAPSLLPPQADPEVAVDAAGITPAPASAPAPAPVSAKTDVNPVSNGLKELQSQFQEIRGTVKQTPDIARARLGDLKHDTLQAAMKDPESAKEFQELIDSISNLSRSIKEDGKKRKDHLADLLKFDAMMRLGQQVGQDVSHGRLFSAVGGGVGGALGLFAGPWGRLVGGGLSAAGSILDQLTGGAGGAREFEKTITDMNQRFGLGDLDQLRNYRLGERYGYTGVESAGMIDRLRENRALDNPAQAGPLVNAIQEMTRALGLNAEATIEMAGVYSRSGGEKGAQGVRGYLADVVGGAIRAGFESNIQQYADMMGSARMQAVQTTGQGVSDRAFNLLQDVVSGLTGGGSRTSGLFRDNTQMAAMGLQSFLAMGGTANPYSTSAAYMRLAGINEANLDTRFNTTEQIAQNAQQSLGWATGRLQEMSGMSAAEFQRNAQNSPNFIQDLLSNSVVMQRQASHIVSGFLGREASANDLRAYEELANIAAANGGRLPMDGSSPDASRVNELLEQLQASPADEMREMEATRHNRVMEVMSHFMDLQTAVDKWMIGIMEWLTTFDLKEVQQAILDAMEAIEDLVKKTMPPILSGISATMKGIDSTIAAWQRLFESPGETLADAGQGLAYTAQQNWRWMRGEDLNPYDDQGVPQWRQILGYVTRTTTMGLEPGAHIMGHVGRSLGILPDDQIRERRTVSPYYENLPASPYYQNYHQNRQNLPASSYYQNQLGAAQRRQGMVEVHGEHNDTPGTVTATPGYNVFRFAPGDVISARQATVPGGATLTDLNLTLNQGINLGIQQHQEAIETAGLLQDVTNKLHDLFGKTQADIETYVAKLFPSLLEGQRFHIDRTVAGNTILDAISKSIPGVVAAIDAVKEAIMALTMASVSGMAGGAMGTGGLGAFASGLFTGPRAHIGGSSSNHIDTKIRADTSWEDIDQYFVAMAQAYAEQNRRIEFSNAGVSGQVFDPNASQAERIAMLRRAAAAHAPHSGWHSFDYYIPMIGDARSESPNSSSAGAEIMLPTLPGGRVEYGSGGRYGNYANLYDENGVLRVRTGHGDDRRALPQGRVFPARGGLDGGGAVQLGSGYSSLEQLSQQLMAYDQRFNTSTPEGRAAIAIALGIGGSEVYSHGSSQTDFFTRRGGVSLDGRRNTMLGFAQFNQDYHAGRTGDPRSYTQFLADILYGESALPNGQQGGNVAQRLSQAVQAGQIQSGAQLEQWMRQNRLGGSNWQGLDDGWRRVPGLSDQLLRMLQTSGVRAQATGPNTNNITINVASANNRAEAEANMRAAIPRLMASLDEFEQRRQVNPNPRNIPGALSPVYS